MSHQRRRAARPGLASLLFFLLCCVISTCARTLPPASAGFVVVFDAGSTGTRAHVYRYSRDGPSPALPRLETLGEAAKAGPLSAAAPGQVADLLAPLIHHALRVIPPAAVRSTDAIFLATAGLRALDRRVADALVAAAAAALKANSPFVVRRGGAAILAGADEAALAWAATNAATGALEGGPATPSTGIVELGGASLQVAFEVVGGQGRAPVADHASVGTLSLAAPPVGSRRGPGGGIAPVILYARSFEGLGHEAAASAAGVEEGGRGRPCLPPAGGGVAAPLSPPGDATGDGEPGPFAKCKAAAAKALASACGHGPASSSHCPLPTHKRARARPPPLLDGVPLLGLENLAHTASFLGVTRGTGGSAPPAKPTLRDLATAGARLCALGPGVVEQPAAPAAEAARHCFGAAYAVTLLHEAFGIALDAATLDFGGRVVSRAEGGRAATTVAPDWAAGAALVAALGGSAGAGTHPFASGVLVKGGGGGPSPSHHHHHHRLGRAAFLVVAGVALASLAGASWPGALGAQAVRAAAGVRSSLLQQRGSPSLLPSRWVGGGSTGSLRASLSRRGMGGAGAAAGSRADLAGLVGS